MKYEESGNLLIGIMADSHDNRVMIKNAVDFFNERGVHLILHAGDYIAPFNYREFQSLSSDFIGVFGNNDGEKRGLLAAFERIGPLFTSPHFFVYGNKRIALMHEPDELDELEASGGFDVIIYGHTHRPEIRKNHSLVINPGELGGWLEGRSTVALLNLASMEAEIIDF